MIIIIKKIKFIYQQENLFLYELYKLLYKSDKNHHTRENNKL